MFDEWLNDSETVKTTEMVKKIVKDFFMNSMALNERPGKA